MPEDDLIYRTCLNYLVAMSVQTNCHDGKGVTTKSGDRRFVCAACILSAGEQWLLVTAGHIVNDLNAMINAGYKVCISLANHWGQNHKDEMLVPLPYEPKNTWSIDEKGLDIGLVKLSINTRDLLRANGTYPIGENHWCHQPSDDEYSVCGTLGLPSESVSTALETSEYCTLNVTPLLARLEHQFDVPMYVMQHHPAAWYGRIAQIGMNDAPYGMDGMSGGPVFGFGKNGDGKIHYQIIGVQFGIYTYEGYTYFRVTPLHLIKAINDRIIGEETGPGVDTD